MQKVWLVNQVMLTPGWIHVDWKWAHVCVFVCVYTRTHIYTCIYSAIIVYTAAFPTQCFSNFLSVCLLLGVLCEVNKQLY